MQLKSELLIMHWEAIVLGLEEKGSDTHIYIQHPNPKPSIRSQAFWHIYSQSFKGDVLGRNDSLIWFLGSEEEGKLMSNY